MKNKAQSRTELFEIRKLNRTALALTCLTKILIKLVSKAVRSNSVQFEIQFSIDLKQNSNNNILWYILLKVKLNLH